MELNELNTFLINHTGAQFFEADKELYLKVFPHSRIKKDVENAGEYNKAALDERMVHELLTSGSVCDCTILENRGFTRDKDGFIVPLKKETPLSEVEKELLEINLEEKLKYNKIKALVFGLQLHAPDQKEETLLNLLKGKKAELIVALNPENTENTEGGEGNAETTGTGSTDPGKPEKTETPITETPGTDMMPDPLWVKEDGVDVYQGHLQEKKSGDQEPNTQA